jgi:DNA-binding MarR family transcriptional regulator
VGELGKKLHLDAGTLTPLLKNLEKNGYVTRQRSKADERVTQIKLTKKGDALKEDCKDIPYQVSSVCSPLKKNEAEALYKILYALLDE